MSPEQMQRQRLVFNLAVMATNHMEAQPGRQAGTARKRLIELLTCKLCKPNKFHVVANATHNARLQALRQVVPQAITSNSHYITFSFAHL